jgi:hypothetical protein
MVTPVVQVGPPREPRIGGADWNEAANMRRTDSRRGLQPRTDRHRVSFGPIAWPGPNRGQAVGAFLGQLVESGVL